MRHLVNCEDSSVAFMDMYTEEKFRGQVKIKMRGDTCRGNQFLALCSGEEGPNYVDTKIWLEYSWFGWHKIRGGDYENNDGSGGAGIMKNADNSSSQYRSNWKKGVVGGRSNNNTKRLAQFQIYLTESSLFDIHHAFGDVISGMDLMDTVLKTKNDDLYVKDCGLIIPPCAPTLGEDEEVESLERNEENRFGNVAARNNNALTLLSLMIIALGCFVQVVLVKSFEL